MGCIECLGIGKPQLVPQLRKRIEFHIKNSIPALRGLYMYAPLFSAAAAAAAASAVVYKFPSCLSENYEPSPCV